VKRKVLSVGGLLLVEGNEHFLIRRLTDLYRSATPPLSPGGGGFVFDAGAMTSHPARLRSRPHIPLPKSG
jgi:hypothetical protein